MKTHIIYKPEDMIAAQNLHWKDSLFGFKFARVVLIMGLIVGAYFAYQASVADAPIPLVMVAVCGGFVLAGASLVATSLFCRILFLPRAALKATTQLKAYHGGWDLEIEDHKLAIKTPRSEALMPFTDFVKWSENDTSILLYITDNQFNFLPKQDLDAAFHGELRTELASAKVPEAGFRNS